MFEGRADGLERLPMSLSTRGSGSMSCEFTKQGRGVRPPDMSSLVPFSLSTMTPHLALGIKDVQHQVAVPSSNPSRFHRLSMLGVHIMPACR